METTTTLDMVLEELTQVRRELREIREHYANVTSENERDATVPISKSALTGDVKQIEHSTDHPHIFTSPQLHQSEPTIRGSGITVRTIIERMRAGETPLEIYRGYPHLSLAKIYDAISYYYYHTPEIDQYIKENEEAMRRARHPAST